MESVNQILNLLDLAFILFYFVLYCIFYFYFVFFPLVHSFNSFIKDFPGFIFQLYTLSLISVPLFLNFQLLSGSLISFYRILLLFLMSLRKLLF